MFYFLDNGVVQSLIASGIWSIKEKAAIKIRFVEMDASLSEILNELDDFPNKEYIKGYLNTYVNCYLNDNEDRSFIQEDMVLGFKKRYARDISPAEESALNKSVSIIDSTMYELLDQKHKILLSRLKGVIKDSGKAISTKIDLNQEEIRVRFNEIAGAISDINTQDVPDFKSSCTKSIMVDQREKFVKNWNATLFLHRSEENAKLTLNHLYLLPSFRYLDDREPHKDSLDAEIEYFIKEQAKYRILIIMGQPGIGKSSLVSYLANRDNSYKYLSFDKLDITEGIIKGIRIKLGCESRDLENQVIVIDGYDENSDNSNTDHIGKLLKEVWSFDKIKIIITSRVHYINTDYENIIVLKQFGDSKIKEFVQKYNSKNKESYQYNLADSNKLEVYGIPLLLYMICSLNIDISNIDGLNELYGRIFTTKEGGIYDKCRFEGVGYGGSLQHKKISYQKEEIHLIAENIAFAMFEQSSRVDGASELCLEEKVYVKIVERINPELIKLFAIANFYDIGNDLRFVHKSIYEYFVALYFYRELKKLNRGNIDDAARRIAELFKASRMSQEIRDFLGYMIKDDSIMRTVNFFNRVCLVFDEMFKYGMTYALDNHKINILECEYHILYNILEFYHMLTFSERRKINNIEKYLKRNTTERLELSSVDLAKSELQRADLSEVNLSGANLSEANLSEADLSRSYLIGVNWIGVNLNGANLSRAYLSEANLRGSDLSRADLHGADLSGSDLSRANLSGANLSGANLSEADLSRADLRGSDLSRANLIRANLSGANLSEADLSGANLSGSDLSKADLIGANLIGSDLRGANLRGSDLRAIRSDMAVTFSKAILYNTIFDDGIKSN